MQGKIIKGVAGAYYVHVEGSGVYECSAKGIFRYKSIKPLVGDNADIKVTDEENKKGNIEDILPRKNSLIRPAVANIDQAVVIFASLSPAPNFNLLSRFLVMMERNDIETVICFNKKDQVEEDELKDICDIFCNSGAKVITTSANTGEGIDELKEILKGKTTAFAGPSGVGKSSILNEICPRANSKTGEISEKINRGKHTTRHTEIFNVADKTYVMDTPGFTSLEYGDGLDERELRFYFNEFQKYEGQCRFNGCLHVNEPDCAVKLAVSEHRISQARYDIYIELYNELHSRRKY